MYRGLSVCPHQVYSVILLNRENTCLNYHVYLAQPTSCYLRKWNKLICIPSLVSVLYSDADSIVYKLLKIVLHIWVHLLCMFLGKKRKGKQFTIILMFTTTLCWYTFWDLRIHLNVMKNNNGKQWLESFVITFQIVEFKIWFWCFCSYPSRHVSSVIGCFSYTWWWSH